MLVLPAAATALILYLAVNEKMYAQPWRFFLYAIISLILVFLFQLSIDDAASAIAKINPTFHGLDELKSALTLVNIVVGAFAGAMIGAAVTNRSLRLNSEKLRSLKEQEQCCRQELDMVKNALANLVLPNAIATLGNANNLKLAQDKMMDLTLKLQDLLDEQSKLTL
ncbi:hypothetical protein CS053_15860 [Rhodanobacter glycinis]|uniref:Uncharacterized protein n=1 Tax=Rhodanobacter glycinis TaxID=582702 RepID=A0A5B9E286_9GAMM|nr:hypothetical protein [Rhodanobacter glycinis]QEE25819.1 hypothetical protein CS053_15860 [Rhodanobacter glycinis]